MQVVTIGPWRQEAPSPDPLGAELDAIGSREQSRDVPRLLAALRLTLRLYGRYVAKDEYAAIVAALTGQEAAPGGA